MKLILITSLLAMATLPRALAQSACPSLVDGKYYGWIGSSEAQSEFEFRFHCDQKDLADYYSKACKVDPNSDESIKHLMDQAMKATALQRLREQVSEYLRLKSVSARKHMTDVQTMAKGVLHLKLEVPETTPWTQAECIPSDSAPTCPNEQEFKTASLKRTLAFENMTRALLLHDSISQELSACRGPEARSDRCISIKNRLDELNTHYEAVLSSPLQPKFRSLISELHSPGLKTVSLSDGDPGPLFDKRIGGYFDAMDKRYNEAINRLQDGKKLAPETTELLTSILRTQLNLDHEQELKAKQAVSALCGMDIGTIVQTYPAAVRQALLEMAPEERETSKLALCESPGFPLIQPHYVCGKTSGGPLPSPVTIDRIDLENYPYSSDNQYTVSGEGTPQNPYLIKLKVYYRSKSPAAETEPLARDLAQHANEYFNLQANKNGPKDMTVKFDIQIESAKGPQDLPVVGFSKCYQTETGSSDCNEIRDYAVKKCIKTYVNYPLRKGECALTEPSKAWVQHCKQLHPGVDATAAADLESCIGSSPFTPAAGSPRLNRLDANHFAWTALPLDQFHEIGHRLGLADEYDNDDLSISGTLLNAVGEQDSLMRDLPGQDRLYERHFRKILEPALRCPR